MPLVGRAGSVGEERVEGPCGQPGRHESTDERGNRAGLAVLTRPGRRGHGRPALPSGARGERHGERQHQHRNLQRWTVILGRAVHHPAPHHPQPLLAIPGSARETRTAPAPTPPGELALESSLLGGRRSAGFRLRPPAPPPAGLAGRPVPTASQPPRPRALKVGWDTAGPWLGYRRDRPPGELGSFAGTITRAAARIRSLRFLRLSAGAPAQAVGAPRE